MLRHNPSALGIELDSAGWVDIDTLLAACASSGRNISPEELRAIVRESDKQRFAISEDGKRIRANQGHSVDVNLQLMPITPPDVLYHGTATRFVESIRKQGLVKGQRHHVHLSEQLDTAKAVGERHGKLHVLRVDARRMHAQGTAFYRSENGVWLTDHVPVEFIDFDFRE